MASIRQEQTWARNGWGFIIIIITTTTSITTTTTTSSIITTTTIIIIIPSWPELGFLYIDQYYLVYPKNIYKIFKQEKMNFLSTCTISFRQKQPI